MVVGEPPKVAESAVAAPSAFSAAAASLAAFLRDRSQLALRVPADALLGEEGQGFRIAMATLDRTRPGVAAMAVGIARAAFEFASDVFRLCRED